MVPLRSQTTHAQLHLLVHQKEDAHLYATRTLTLQAPLASLLDKHALQIVSDLQLELARLFLAILLEMPVNVASTPLYA